MADRIRIIPHFPEGIPDCGSFEVRFPDGRYWGYEPHHAHGTHEAVDTTSGQFKRRSRVECAIPPIMSHKPPHASVNSRQTVGPDWGGQRAKRDQPRRADHTSALL